MSADRREAGTFSGRVNVTHEYGVLKEVVVGRAENLQLPTYSQDFSRQVHYAPEAAKARMGEMAGQFWQQVDPESYGRAVEQLDHLVRFLEARGVIVHRPELFTAEQRALWSSLSTVNMQIFVRDPMVVIGNNVIETNLRMPYRNKERFGLQTLLSQLSERTDARIVGMPFQYPVHQDAADQSSGLYLEGGDVFVLGKDILVGYNGRTATSLAGIRWLARYLGDDYRVHPVPLTQDVLHLDDGLALVREGLAIVLVEQFAHGIPEILKGWDLIEVSKFEALNYLAGNGLVLRPGEIVIDARLPHLAEALSARNVTVHTIEYDAVTLWAGGLRCSHHPIVREL
ncbi:N-Dimethylarginine dimethylaminohydrolase [Enhydrobacter aerosaccus]|uniref:N-Dimethylarginine dimethylaminohydrolase n=1 Tax=Enhydrobacter aerosaccus TaxID=225324 RepID=A0A1T4TEC4_9HYPH|nr:arginine deiminase family protein [Enhydrobacter aerosaccus]SKA38796.1 N-Dimethylarginine dimethylaminohydrolase [Enhydrobacter aerosaccus]